jgi:hypothetical protein
MKIDRVILSSNNNPTYYHFWNPISKVYSEKFGIKPTLVWAGTEEELRECNISTEYGEVIIQPPKADYHIPWQTTWMLFWATQFYPEDVCLIIGIDQIPLSGMFIKDMIQPYSNEDYLMLIADAYRPHYWNKEGSASPSSYHIAKGKTFDKVHKFLVDWYSEADKVHKSGIDGFWENTEGRWGIDETYSCHNLRNSKDVNIVGLDNFTLLCERRIECERHKETPYDINKLQQGWYSESHLCRPFTNHTEYITNLFNAIPDYKSL